MYLGDMTILLIAYVIKYDLSFVIYNLLIGTQIF